MSILLQIDEITYELGELDWFKLKMYSNNRLDTLTVDIVGTTKTIEHKIMNLIDCISSKEQHNVGFTVNGKGFNSQNCYPRFELTNVDRFLKLHLELKG